MICSSELYGRSLRVITTSGWFETGASRARSSDLYLALASASGVRMASLGEPMISV
ncbi:hypothetical protein D3C81_919350 [compost metagenome]